MTKMKQLIVSAVVFLGILMAGQAMASKLADQSGSDEPIGMRSIMSPVKVDARTQPSAKVCLQGEECASAQPVAAAAEPAAKSAEDMYGACAACHGTGAAGAPKLGDKDAWAARIAQGKDTLYSNAINGFNMMPPRGTCAACSDDDIKAIVDYMVEQSQ